MSLHPLTYSPAPLCSFAPPALVRASGPEALFTMTLPSFRDADIPQVVRVPGIIVQGGDPRFVAGYLWGRERYWSEVDNLSQTPDGWLHASQVEAFISQFLECEDPINNAPLVMRTGAIVGYLATATEDFYGLHKRPAMAPDDAFSAIVPSGTDYHGTPQVERVRVPGCIIADADPDFPMAYSLGRDLYMDDVYELQWADGSSKRMEVTFEQFHLLRSCKVRDISSGELVQTILHELVMLREEEYTRVEVAAILTGYIAACVEESYGFTCPRCGRSQGCCKEVVHHVH